MHFFDLAEWLKSRRAKLSWPSSHQGIRTCRTPRLPCVEVFIGECTAFPSGAHDDQVDGWSSKPSAS